MHHVLRSSTLKVSTIPASIWNRVPGTGLGMQFQGLGQDRNVGQGQGDLLGPLILRGHDLQDMPSQVATDLDLVRYTLLFGSRVRSTDQSSPPW